MRLRCKISILLSCLLLSAAYIYIWLNPIIVDKSEIEYPSFNTVGVHNPIDTIDFSEGDNRIVIYTHPEDVIFLSREVKKWTLLETTDNKIIEQIKKTFHFEGDSSVYGGTTAYDSMIYFIKNNKVVYKTKYYIDNRNISVCFNDAGWTHTENDEELIQAISEFDRVYLPIVVLQ